MIASKFSLLREPLTLSGYFYRRKQYANGLSSDFHAKFNGNTVRGSSDTLYLEAGGQVQDGQAGGQVQHGQAGVHDGCGGVV